MLCKDPERVVQEAEAAAPDIPGCGNAARQKGVFCFQSILCTASLALGTSVGQGRNGGFGFLNDPFRIVRF
jgi:hypothetical protein